MNNESLPPITKETTTDNQNNGWLGIVPGTSLLPQVLDKFGQPDLSWRMANATGYSFAGETIEVTVLDSDREQIISRLRILNGCPCEKAIPETLAQANEIFGPLQQTEISESSIATFERPGVRIACELFGDPPKIKWVEFYLQQ